METKAVRPLLFALALLAAGASHGQNEFRGLTTTADGYSTFDADMVNVENVSQTGAGVYVAVLDTGLAA
ncbi:MAG TPA: hypothetical protein VMU03_12235, partial [Gammaproteobacteria bacterium]|nr:hypothetical protein [Gammaproteobacteria bacterium]